MWGLLGMTVPDVQVTLGSPSSSGVANTKAVIAVQYYFIDPQLVYISWPLV